VGLPATYVGVEVGEEVGAFEGGMVGEGVGFKAVYVGDNVGFVVGSLEGKAVGTFVGDPAW